MVALARDWYIKGLSQRNWITCFLLFFIIADQFFGIESKLKSISDILGLF